MKLFAALNEKTIALLEADTEKAKKAEPYVVSVINKNKGIREQLKITDNSKAVVFAGTGTSLTPKWATWSGKVKKDGSPEAAEPKTDILIGNIRASLKAGPAQIISAKAGGTQSETIATLNAALEMTNLKEKILKSIKEELGALAESTKVDYSGGGAEDRLKKGEKAFVKIDKTHKKLTQDLANIFENNQSLREAFVFEGMTGNFKFGKASNAAANYIIVTDKYDDLIKNKEIRKFVKINNYTDSYIKEISKKVKIKFAFKSSSDTNKTTRSIWSKLSIMTTEEKDKSLISLKKNEAFLISEGLGDLVDTLKNKTKDVYAFIMQKIQEIISLVKNALEKGIQYLLDLLAIDIEVNFSNNLINW
jgi:cell division protein ZapA (FtsZ GTPase activity inhibitor)